MSDTMVIDVKRFRRIINRSGEATMLVWTESDNPRIETAGTFTGNPGEATKRLYESRKFWNPSKTILVNSADAVEVFIKKGASNG